MGTNEPDAGEPTAREPAPVPSHSTDETAPEQALSEQDEERLIEELVSRGEAVPEGTELPPGATHEIVRDDQGRRHLRRKRFSAL